MSGIRVTYSGLISFVISLTTIITGLFFTLILTRELSVNEYGLWALIGTLTTYVYTIYPTISYWTTREIARGEESAKTAFNSIGLLSSVAVVVYLLISYYFSLNSEIDYFILVFAALLIPSEFFNQILKAINRGYKPQMEEYGVLIFEIIKVPIAFLTIYVMELGVVGIIIAVFGANLASIIFLTIKTRKKLRGQFKKMA